MKLKWWKQHIFLLIGLPLFLLHQWLEPHVALPFIDSYLDDFLFFPIVLSAAQLLLQRLFGPHVKISMAMGLLSFALTAFATEYLFPKLSARHVADVYDLLAYAAGLLLFFAGQAGQSESSVGN